MGEIVTRIGQLPVYTLSLFVVMSFLWFGFVVYKKGVEYHIRDESLFDLIILSGLLGWIFARFGFVIANLSIFSQNWLRIILVSAYPGYSFLGLFLGIVLADLLLSYRGEIKTYEGLDLLGLGFPAAASIWYLGLVFSGHISFVWHLPKELLLALCFLVAFVWLWKMEREYRTFEWYRFRKTQARSGFIFGAFLCFLGLILVASSLVVKINVVDLGIGAMFIVFGCVFVYWRSGRSLSHDVKALIKKKPVVYTNLK